MYTDGPVSRTFNRGESLQLNVEVLSPNDYDFTSESLAWYHNGSRIISGGRHTISSGNTRLTINDLRDFDAGFYKVNFTFSCDYPLPSTADFVPVVFTVQEHSLPVYDPLNTVLTYYVMDISRPRVYLNASVPSHYYTTLGFTRGGFLDVWHKDGMRVYEDLSVADQDGKWTATLELTGIGSESASGIYTVALLSAYEDTIWDNCSLARHGAITTIGYSIWNVKTYRELIHV